MVSSQAKQRASLDEFFATVVGRPMYGHERALYKCYARPPAVKCAEHTITRSRVYGVVPRRLIVDDVGGAQ